MEVIPDTRTNGRMQETFKVSVFENINNFT
jgi:hypothetical protein